LAKHGIDFEQAQAIWDDKYRLELDLPWATEGRWMMCGLVDDKIWSAIFTRRDDNIRIISVRRARKIEVVAYDTEKDNG
jgi:uncharacterized DUF497 family protein